MLGRGCYFLESISRGGPTQRTPLSTVLEEGRELCSCLGKSVSDVSSTEVLRQVQTRHDLQLARNQCVWSPVRKENLGR